MKKNKFHAFPLFFILYLFLSALLPAKNYSQESVNWTKPLTQCWAHQSSEIAQTELASDNEFVFSAFLDGKISALHSKTGEIQWTTELGNNITLNLQADRNSVFILNETESKENIDDTKLSDRLGNSELLLRSIDVASGIVNWSTTFTHTGSNTQMFLYDNRIILVTKGGSIIFINSQDGKIADEYKTGKEVSASYIQDETIVIGTNDKKLILFPISGSQLSKELSVPEIVHNIFLKDEGRIFWTGEKGILNVINIDSGRMLWTKKFGAGVSGISNISKELLITSLDNFIYFTDNKGNTLWKRRLAARVLGKPFIKDKTSILSAFGDSTALFIDLKAGKIVNSISLSDANYFTGRPVYINDMLIFPTLSGLFAFSNQCPKK